MPIVFAVLCATANTLALFAQDAAAQNERKVREIFVPFDELSVVLEGQPQRVFMTRQEYEDLSKTASRVQPDEKAPISSLFPSADYLITIQDKQARIEGTLGVQILNDELLELPLLVNGISLRSVSFDGNPAAVGRNPEGKPVLFVRGRGQHEVKLSGIVPLSASAAQQHLVFKLPPAASARWHLVAPGNVELKSGAAVIERQLEGDGTTTRFELLPQRDTTTLVLSLNNRVLMQDRVVLARSVFLSELTRSYERLHASISLAIPHGAVDRFRFQIPAGFEVTDVTTPMLARWAVDAAQAETRILEVVLREATKETVVLNIVATNNAPNLAAWSMPHFTPLDVANHVSVIGVLAEERLVPDSLTTSTLIPINVGALEAAIPPSVLQAEPGAPRIRPVQAFFSPQGEFQLTGVFSETPVRLEVTSNLLLSVGEKELQLRAGFALFPKVEKLFSVDISVPAGWQIQDVTQADGNKLTFQVFATENGGSRLQVRLPSGAPVGSFFNLFVQARAVPPGWLNQWSETTLQFPVFAVQGADRDIGAIAVQMLDDLSARPEQLNGLTPLDEKEKAEFGWKDSAASLTYRYEAPTYSANLLVERKQPRLTARTFSFVRLTPEGLAAHYELLFQVENARTRNLAFRLPASTPESISVRGINVTVKEFQSSVDGDERVWSAQLSEPRDGEIKLAVDFIQSLPGEEPKDFPLPIIRADNVAYQSGTISVEGSAEFDVAVKTSARPVDVGELVDAEYQVGKRLLGAYGYVGDSGPVLADIVRRPEFALPAAIVQRAELVTLLSAHGLAQTAARYHLRTKAHYLELVLPPGAELWSTTVNGRPASPQREGDRLLVSLPATDSAIQDLQVVYESSISRVELFGNVYAFAPKLALRSENAQTSHEVPLADLKWHVVLPDGQRIVRTSGTVYSDEPVRDESLFERMGDLSHRLQAEITPSTWFDAMQPGSDVNRTTAGAEAARTYTVDEAPKMGIPPAGAPAPMGEGPTSEAAAPVPTEPPMSDEAVRDGQVRRPDAARDSAFETLPQPAAEGKPAIPASDLYWALQGVRSLPIEIVTTGRKITFVSMGVDPQLRLTLANTWTIRFFSWVIAAAVLVAGFCYTGKRTNHKVAFLFFALFASLIGSPLLGLLLGLELDGLFQPTIFAVGVLLVWYLVASFFQAFGAWASRVVRRRSTRVATTNILLLAIAGVVSASPLYGQTPADASAPGEAPSVQRALIDLLLPGGPVKLPDDALLVPYYPSEPDGPRKATKVLIPYSQYVELWNRAFPNDPLTTEKPVVPFAVAGAQYTLRLDADDVVTMIGKMQIDLFVDEQTTIPLPIGSGVLTEISLDGQPARTQIIGSQAPQDVPNLGRIIASPTAGSEIVLLHASGKGRKSLTLSIRYRVSRNGGWRSIAGQLPSAAATAWDVVVPTANTEVRIAPADENVIQKAANAMLIDAVAIETTTDNQTIQMAIPPSGQFQLQWRPKIVMAQVDRSLTARSIAAVDVQEDGLRIAWQLQFEFGRGSRDTISLTVPKDFPVERILGPNIRGWKSTEEGDAQRIDITLLKAAVGSETFTMFLARRRAFIAAENPPIQVPVIAIAEAAMHQGEVTIRRSPRLEVRIGRVDGLNRAEPNAQQLEGLLAGMADESPLGIRPFQTYRFNSTPFTLELFVTPHQEEVTVEVQSLFKLGERESRYESKLHFVAKTRPTYITQLILPAGLTLDAVEGPPGLEWTTKTEAAGERLTVFMPTGQQQFSLVLRGRIARGEGDVIEVPRLVVQNVAEQQGEIVVQVDPAFDLRIESVAGAESVLLERVFRWLRPDQRPLARVALHYDSPEYVARLRVIPRVARVQVFTVSNVRITPFAIEDTVYFQYTIQEAGIREVAFILPAEMRDARITVPLLRQKTIEPIAENPALVRVRLELQDEVTDQLIVLVEHDRALTSATFEAPIPSVLGARVDNRYVVLENAGRDEVIVAAVEGMTELSRQQSEWARLAGTLGDRITQAYLVEGETTNPRLLLQTRQRTTLETAGARIPLATTLLAVDPHGAYRGMQEYRVDNKTEQYLEVELPDGAELWTVRVAGEPVRPTTVAGTSTRARVRIPLIKTSPGDLDYPVELKYGGWLRIRRGLGKVQFPLVHTVNIQVEQSQVRLRLPESHRWFDFGGTMRRVRDEGDLIAGIFSYRSKQMEQLLGVVSSASTDEFSKLRASNNLKQLGLTLDRYRDDSVNYSDNEFLQGEVSKNTALLQQAQQVVEQQSQLPAQTAATDNRSILSFLCASQELSRSKNVVTNLTENFDFGPTSGTEAAEKTAEGFNVEWFRGNKLENAAVEKKDAPQRLLLGDDKSGKQQQAIQNSVVESEGRAAASALGKKLADELREEDPTAAVEGADARFGGRRSGERLQQLERYQSRLEGGVQAADPQPVTQNAPGMPGMAGGLGLQDGRGPSPATPGMTDRSTGNGAFGGGLFGQASAGAGGQVLGDFAMTDGAVATVAGMKSLEIELPVRGTEYLFFTTRGDIEIDARSITDKRSNDAVQVLVILLGAGALILIYRAARPK